MASDSVLRSRPSIVAVIFFGWLFLLVRAALVKKTAVCRDCGATRRYRSEGGTMALLALVVLVVMTVLAVVGDLDL